MGTIIKGILGGFSGTVGTVVGATWKGIDYMKGKSRKRSGTSSTAQLQQQAKFGMMLKFLRTFRKLLKTSFKEFAVGESGTNVALSVNLQQAVTGDYPAFTLNYPKVMLSHGNLEEPEAPKASSSAVGKVDFTWTNSVGEDVDETEHAMLVIYNPSTQKVVYKLNAAKRTLGTDSLDAPQFSGLVVETWMAFVSANGKSNSDSAYTGSVTIL